MLSHLSLRCPKLLPCQHTFCLPCLEGCAESSGRQLKVSSLFSSLSNLLFECPECRAENSIPYEGVKAFQTNYTLTAFLDIHLQVEDLFSHQNVFWILQDSFLSKRTRSTLDRQIEMIDWLQATAETSSLIEEYIHRWDTLSFLHSHLEREELSPLMTSQWDSFWLGEMDENILFTLSPSNWFHNILQVQSGTM